MAETEESGYLSHLATQSSQGQGPISTVELFENASTHSHRPGLATAPVWSRSDNDLHAETQAQPQPQERNKFVLSTEAASARIQPLQGTSNTGYAISSSQGGDGSFDYQKEMQNLDQLSAQLDTVKEQLMADILRCQLLHVDLATQFDPGLVQQLRATKLSCEKCENNLDDSVTSPAMD